MRRSEPAAGDRPRHLAIVGPTASGKSALGLAVARALGDSEIVSLDSMQVYRGMDIGTAKSPAGERSDVVHHVVDVADPAEEWSVVRTQAAVRGAIDSIEARGRRAVLVGGTGLYVRAVVDGITVPAEDAGVRSALEAEWQGETGLASAYDELAARDPEAAARIEPGNRRRIIRALEVMRVTGRPFSAFGRGLDHYGPPAIDVVMVGVWISRALMWRRIAERFAAMREAGLVEEVRTLAGEPGGLSRTARQAIGYKEVLAHLEGETELEEALDLAVRRTRALGRRQRVWFRRDPRIIWMGIDGNAEALAPAVLATLRGPADGRDQPDPPEGGR